MTFSTTKVLVTILLYVAALFTLAQWGERSAWGKRIAAHPVTFALGLSVYCTTWTFFGSVGRSATAGMQYLPVYLGPTLALLLGWTVFRRIAQLRHAHRLTSIADFISARYAKSQRLAALVTLTLAIGIIPYIALQLKSILSCVQVMTGDPTAGAWFGPVLVVLMVGFTIVFGIRHLDPTERHPGMVVAVAAEGLVKLVAFVAAGVFVVLTAFPSTAAFFSRLDEVGAKLPTLGKTSGNDFLTFVTTTFLSAAAFAFLPRQFHQGIIENSKPDHVRTAAWLTPLYLLAINLLVVPIAIGGHLIAKPGTSPDVYVLALPLQAGRGALSMAVFIGGFSAALGMVIIETMTMATMVSNHLVLPLATRFKPLARLRSRLLHVRWAAAATLLVVAWQFAVKLGASQMLVSIGLISFAAAFLLAPVILGGLFWRDASERGAFAGVAAGFGVWAYTLMLPTFVRSHWLPERLLTAGPFGIGWLKPEALFGIAGLPSLAHGAILSALVCVIAYVGVSVLAPPTKEEQLLTDAFLEDAAQQLAHLDDREATIDVDEQKRRAESVFAEYMPRADAARCVTQALHESIGHDRAKLTVVQYASLLASFERTLAGAVGSASAHAAMKAVGTIDRKDKRELEREFARILAELKLNPRELKNRVDFEKEKARLLEEQFRVLEVKNDELELKVLDRTREIRAILDNVIFGFLVVDSALVVREGHTRSCAELLGCEEIAGRPLPELLGLSGEASRGFQAGIEQVFEDFLPEDLTTSQLPQRFEIAGRVVRAEARAVRDENGGVAVLLFTLSDVTRLEAAERENDDNRAILNIVRQRSAFEAFVDETKQNLTTARSALTSGDDKSVRRAAHTIKGNAATYGVTDVVRVVHAVEDQAVIHEAHLEEISVAFRGFLESHVSIIGLSFDRERPRTFTLNDRDFVELNRVAANLPEEDRSRLSRWLREVTLVPAQSLVGRIDELVRSVAARRGKEVELTLEGLDHRVEPSQMKRVLQSVVHLIRNCVDHGIEPADARGDKPPRGQIRLEVSVSPTEHVVRVADDGRGIDLDAVTASAVGHGVLTAEEATRLSTADRLALIFADAVSTAAEVSDVSGRGVGMSAVKSDVEAAGGRISVETTLGVGTSFEIRVPRHWRPSMATALRPARLSVPAPAASAE